jgi:uncharacterized protein YutE (UPF0331/DUF86 family)
LVERQLIAKRLEVIDDCLKRAARLGRVPKARFVATPEIHMLAERCLHLAMEAVLDIANHVVSDRGLESPESYADSIRSLATVKVISRGVADRLIPWVGFRNLLVHGYIKLDHGKTHDSIRKDLGALRSFCKAAAKLL